MSELVSIIVVTHNSWLGEDGGRNEGFRASRVAFRQFLEGDDFLTPKKIEKRVETLGNYPDTDIVYGELRHFETCPGIRKWEDWDAAQHENMLATLESELASHSILFRYEVLLRACETRPPWLRSLRQITSWLRIDERS